MVLLSVPLYTVVPVRFMNVGLISRASKASNRREALEPVQSGCIFIFRGKMKTWSPFSFFSTHVILIKYVPTFLLQRETLVHQKVYPSSQLETLLLTIVLNSAAVHIAVKPWNQSRCGFRWDAAVMCTQAKDMSFNMQMHLSMFSFISV